VRKGRLMISGDAVALRGRLLCTHPMRLAIGLRSS
jgi:hypothetical protein